MFSQRSLTIWPQIKVFRIILGAVIALTFIPFGSSVVYAATSTKSVACQKVFTEVVNADKVYIALQYGVVKAATDYVASNSLQNRLLYNDSFITAIAAANKELTFAITNPRCYPAKNITGYQANVKSNLKQIAGIHNANVNGQLVGNPQKMTTFKPVGLLK